MKKFIVYLMLCMPLFLAASGTIPFAISGVSTGCLSETVTVIATGPGAALVEWSVVNQPGYLEYTISVYDITRGQLVNTLLTTNTSISVGNLTSGHTYRFKVETIGSVVGSGDIDMG